jgi:hypothetical protein
MAAMKERKKKLSLQGTIGLKEWREANGFSQSQAVRVLNETGNPLTLEALQTWEARPRNSHSQFRLFTWPDSENPKKSHAPGQAKKRKQRST